MTSHQDELDSGQSVRTDGEANARAEEKAWREYQLLVEVYKFYLDLTVKFIAAYFAIVGAIVTLVLTNVRVEQVVAWALWVPVLLSLLTAVGTLKATPKAKETLDAVRGLAQELDIRGPVHVELLVWMVSSIPALALGIALLLIGMFISLIVH